MKQRIHIDTATLFLKSGARGRFYMKKKFDAVKFQRKVRGELGKRYSSNRDGFLRELKEKYGHLHKRKNKTTTR